MDKISFLLMLRNLKKFKAYSLLGIAGFSLSLSLTLFAVFCIVNETQYDTFHKDHKNIYRVTSKLIYKNGDIAEFARVMPWVGPYLGNEFPEVEAVARFTKPEGQIIAIDDRKFKEEKVMPVDSSFFKVFGFKIIYGNWESVFNELGTAVLTKQTAMKYFGTDDAVGKTFQIGRNTFTVTGVVESGHVNSHFSFNVLIASYYLNRGWSDTESGTHRSMFVYTYVRFKEGFSYDNSKEKLNLFENRYLTTADLEETGLHDWKILLQPITDIHIGSKMKRELEENIETSTINLISAVTLVIILLAGLNYIILTSAVYSKRVKEIAIQKIHGAGRAKIILDIIKESVLFNFVSLLFAFVFLLIDILLFGNLFYERSLDLTIFFNPGFFLVVIGLAFIIGVLGSIYPSISFSSIKALSILHPTKRGVGSTSFLLKLCGLQAVISILIIGFTYVVIQQLSFFNAKDYGFDKDHLIVLHAPPGWQGYQSFRNQLLQIPQVNNVSQTLNYPGGFVEEGMTRVEGGNETFLMPAYDGCEDFIETMGFTLVDGRSFVKSDDWKSVIVNEAAVEKFGWKNSALGRKIFAIEGRGVEAAYNVVGVVKDFHYYSAHEQVEPFRIHMRCDRMDDILVKTEKSDSEDFIKRIREMWLKLEPDILFDYTLVKDIYEKKYERESKLVDVFTVFSAIAILITIMGFYSISSITAHTRLKEIGIRKILGASAFDIFKSITSKFLSVFCAAALIAVPILYFIIEEWLARFAYSITIEIMTFVIPIILITIIALFSFSYYIIKAARINPTSILKYE